jgi:predicted membrane protein
MVDEPRFVKGDTVKTGNSNLKNMGAQGGRNRVFQQHGSLASLAVFGVKLKTLDNFCKIKYEYEMNNITKTMECKKEKITKELSRQYSLNKISLLSSRRTSGSILNEINGKIISILGDNHIIINNGDLIKDETFIDVVVVLGEIVIHIPEDITVINKVVHVLGGIFGNDENNNNHGKKLTITGKVILGNITIKQKK